jgi:hypothetical protein
MWAVVSLLMHTPGGKPVARVHGPLRSQGAVKRTFKSLVKDCERKFGIRDGSYIVGHLDAELHVWHCHVRGGDDVLATVEALAMEW